MSPPNFTSVLDQQAEAVEAPKPIPPGTYTVAITGFGEEKTIGKNQTPCIEFPVMFMAPGDDVDSAALQEALTSKNGMTKPLNQVKMKIRQFTTEDSAWRLKEFLVDHLQIDGAGKTLRQMLSEVQGRQCLVTIKHEMTHGDNPRILANISGTAKAA